MEENRYNLPEQKNRYSISDALGNLKPVDIGYKPAQVQTPPPYLQRFTNYLTREAPKQIPEVVQKTLNLPGNIAQEQIQKKTKPGGFAHNIVAPAVGLGLNLLMPIGGEEGGVEKLLAKEGKGIAAKSAEELFGGKISQIEADELTQQRAFAETVKPKGSGLKGFSDELKNLYKNWINRRKAARDVEGAVVAKTFRKYDEGGLEHIFNIQSGDRAYSDVRKFFDKKLDEVNEAGRNLGVEVGRKLNYLPQLWLNSEAEINRVFQGKTLTLRPSFSLDSIIEDYKTGMAAGLEPKFETVGKLASWYESYANKFIADSEFFSPISKRGLVQPAELAPRDWISYDPDHFPLKRVAYGNKVYSGVMKGPPEFVNMVNNYLKTPNPTLQHIANIVGTLKNTALSVGVPGTGFNVHEFNIFPRSFISSFSIGDNPQRIAKRAANSIKYLFAPNSAARYLDEHLSQAAEFARKSDFTISAEEHAADSFASGFGEGKVGKTISKVREKLFDVFGANTFRKIIPATKTQWMSDLVDKFVAHGMERDEAIKTAGPIINNWFGGINWRAAGRPPDVQNLLRVFIFAPDFAETILNLGKGLFKKGIAGNEYRKFAGAFLASYIGANVINYRNTGHLMYQNDTLHQFSVAIGKDSKGKTIYWNPFGTGFDFLRIPQEAITAIARGQGRELMSIIRNRLSQPFGSAVSLISNTDWAGYPILGPDKYGRPQSLMAQISNVFNNTIGNVFPGSVQESLKGLQGKASLEEVGIKSLGLPFSFTRRRGSTGINRYDHAGGNRYSL